ncbi:hypothetical protein L0244_33460, partial [bacterium]|nr:hypothetical protein [bacterium]
GFSKTAIQEIEKYRTREIMLFTPFEMASLFNHEIDIHKLIEMKLDLLRTDGIAWFYKGQKRIKTSHKLEKDGKLFFKQGNFFISSASESSDMIDSLFARTIPDTNWGNYGDCSALLQLDLDINNIEDLEEVLCLIDELFGLTKEGSYSIRQWNISWFGFGASNFLLDAKNWNRRYQENPPEKIHHSESLSYFDSFQDGWMLLNCNQRVWLGNERESMIHRAEIVIQLPGVPLDLSLLRKFCREIHNENARFYQTNYHKIFHKRLKKPIKLEVVGEVIQTKIFLQDSELAVNGVVAKNPFFKRKKLPKEFLDGDNFLFGQLCKLEYLICAVKDWYDLGDVMDAFDLYELEAMQAGSVFVFRPICTWRNILKSKKTQNFSSNKLIANSIIEKHVKAQKIWDSVKKIKK